MSRLSTAFQLSMYSLAALSSAILALAEGYWLPTALGVPLAFAALILTERRGTVRLRPAWANFFGMLALGLASAEFFRDNIEARLLSGAHLIVYLLWIVLFLEKTARHYWWMSALCVLQVAVASVLTADGWFGALLVLYFFGGIWTLSVFTLYRAQQSFAAAETPRQPEGPPAGQHGSAPRARPGMFSLRGRGTVRGSIQSDSGERWIGLRFAAGTIGWACLAMLVAAVFFLAIPRVWIGRTSVASERDGGAVLRTSVTGFTDQVRLGDFGRILESTEPVLEVRLFDDATDEPLDVAEYAAQLGYDEPLFRGAVLSRYENGRWRVEDSRYAARFARADRRTRRGTVRQEFRLQPIGTAYLFAIHPVVSCRLERSTSVVRLQRYTSTLSLQDGEPARDEIAYYAWSPRRSMERPVVSEIEPNEFGAQAAVRWRDLRLPDNLDRLQQTARRVAEADEENPPSPDEMAQRLLAYLRDSGEYGYSLDASIQNAAVDPIEDFLFFRKQGHCEYFASALTLMLRSVGIPSRLVSGYKGGELNRFTGAFVVEQRHAHAWVEANLNNQWVVLDPTPSEARAHSVVSLGSSLSTWREFSNLLTGFWARHIVGMDLARQRETFYRPLEVSARHWWESLKQGRIRTSTLLSQFKLFLTSPERWFSWQGGAVTFVLLLFLSGVVWLARRLWRFAHRLIAHYRRHRSRARIEVEFYERFRKICESQGLRRESSQTQREFAAIVARRMNALLAAAGLAEFPERLIEAFYRVRFGAESLDDRLIEEMDRRLSDLERSLQQPRPGARVA